MKPIETLRLAATATLIALGTSSVALANEGHDKAKADDGDNHGPQVSRLLLPDMDSERGMNLFIEKGCYTCHSVNGVGGEDAASLDAHDMAPYMNPFDLAAKMWTMASIMIPAQEEALGAQIEFTGDELTDIIAFLHDDEQQHKFVEDLLTEEQLAAIEHGHGGVPGSEAHEEELGHGGGSGGDEEMPMHDDSNQPAGHGHGDGDGDDDDHDQKG